MLKIICILICKKQILGNHLYPGFRQGQNLKRVWFPFVSRVELPKLLLFAKRNTRSLWRLTINCFSAIAIPRRSTKERIVLQDLFVMKMNQNLDSNNKTIWMTFRVQCDISLLSSVGGKWCFRREKQTTDNLPRLGHGLFWKTKCHNWILVWLVERI